MLIWLPRAEQQLLCCVVIFWLFEEIYRYRVTSDPDVPFILRNQIFNETRRCVFVFFNHPKRRTMALCESFQSTGMPVAQPSL